MAERLPLSSDDASNATPSSPAPPRHSLEPMLQESFKLSKEELDMLRRLAEASPHQSRGAVLRDLIRVAAGQLPHAAPKKPVSPKPPRLSKAARAALSPSRLPPHPDLLRHIARVGGLVNQVARGIHAARHQGTHIDVVILHFTLVVIRIELENLRENYTARSDEAEEAKPDGMTPPGAAEPTP